MKIRKSQLKMTYLEGKDKWGSLKNSRRKKVMKEG